MFRHKFWVLSILLAALVLVGCSARSADYSEAPMEMPAAEGYAPSEEMVQIDYAADESLTANSVPPGDVDRIIIKTANMTLVVNNPPDSLEKIKKLAEGLGGYVVSSNLSQTTLDNGTKVPYGSISIRVPAEKLDEVLEEIRAESDQLPINENVDSQDVTSNYVDLESRLKNLEATEQQLAEIMDQADETEDVLAVYNELVRVREQIEVIKGQMKYYKESAALSLVNVELMANEAVQPLTIAGWQPGGVVKDSIQSLINFLQGLVDFLIRFILLILPALLLILLIFVLPVYLIVRAIRRRAKRKKAEQPAPEQAEKPV
jgi:hypothetical protein